MNEIIEILQISTALIFFVHKIFLLLGRKTGWAMGFFGCLIAGAYFIFIHLYIYVVLEYSLVLVMAYGFFKKENSSPRVKMAIQGLSVGTMILMACFMFSGKMTIVELSSSIAFVIGTYWLATGKMCLGWSSYVFAHIMATILTMDKEQLFFAHFQIASAIVCLIGVIEYRRK